MIVVCPACQARFQYADGRFGGAPVKRFKCPKCSHVFEVANPALAAPRIVAVPPPAPAPMPEAEPTPPGPRRLEHPAGWTLPSGARMVGPWPGEPPRGVFR